MKNLHKIHTSIFPITDELMAQIWAVVNGPHRRFRITTRKGETNLQTPIQRDLGNEEWVNWIYEPERLRRWTQAGKPQIDLSRIEIGDFPNQDY